MADNFNDSKEDIITNVESNPEDIEVADESNDSNLFGVLLPYLIGTVIVTCLLFLAFIKFVPNARSGTPNIVTFDVAKLANAERAIASNLIAKNEKANESAIILTKVGKKAEAMISEVAGPNTIVLVKQTVVGYNLPDITDEVLTRLELPTDVITYSPSDTVLRPTMEGLKDPSIYEPIPRKKSTIIDNSDPSEQLLPN